MLALSRLSPSATGFVLSSSWLAAALVYWNAPAALPAPLAISISGAALLLIVLGSQVFRLSEVARARLAVLGLAIAATSASLFRPEPAVVLLAVTAFIMLAAATMGHAYQAPPSPRDRHALALDHGRGVAIGALLTVVVLAATSHEDTTAKVALNGAIGWSALLLTRGIEAETGRGPTRAARRLFLASAIVSPVVWLPSLDPSGAALLPLLLVLAGNAALGARSASRPLPAGEMEGEEISVANRAGSHALDWVTARPARALAVTFALAGAIGGVLLALPISAGATGGEDAGISLIDALFTAFSAVCVTGLIVVDTPNDFGPIGQVILLALIQVGGLGIMTFSTATLTILGNRMSLRQEATAARLANVADRRQIGHSVRTILVVTFVAEAVGAAVLTLTFAGLGDAWGVALWRGVFTSVSAFCNAGFALQSDSMVSYQQNPLVLLSCTALIVVGGLGPLLVVSASRATRRGARLDPGQRIALGTTAVLFLASFIAFTLIEWNNTLDHLSVPNRITNGVFQAATLRTAGFNSVDFALLHPACFMVVLPMMFVGGCPGSTAGGIKTTTIALMFLNLRATMRRDAATIVSNRTISTTSTRNASAVLLLGAALVLGVTLLLLLTQEIAFLPAVFESISALATVGLSMGATGELDEVGETILIIAMFVGRLGPQALLLALGSGDREGIPTGRHPEVQVELA